MLSRQTFNGELCYDLENAPYCTKTQNFSKNFPDVITPVSRLKEQIRKGKEGGSGWEGEGNGGKDGRGGRKWKG
jgi:hypothetical protein